MLQGYFITESSGDKLGIFIINKAMRYHIPFQPVDKVIEKLKEGKTMKTPGACVLTVVLMSALPCGSGCKSNSVPIDPRPG